MILGDAEEGGWTWDRRLDALGTVLSSTTWCCRNGCRTCTAPGRVLNNLCLGLLALSVFLAITVVLWAVEDIPAYAGTLLHDAGILVLGAVLTLLGAALRW